MFPPFRAEDYRQEVHAQVYSCLARSPAGSVHSRDVNVRAGKCQSLFCPLSIYRLAIYSILLDVPETPFYFNEIFDKSTIDL